jgi:hypothetical protein
VAKQTEVIGPREFMSRMWYRKIGAHRYRFRFTPKPNIGPGAFEVTAHRFVKWAQPWEPVHKILITKGGK